MNRRKLMQSACASVAAFAWAAKPAYATQRAHADLTSEPLREFNYVDVQLSDGVAHAQLEATHQILMGMDEDSLLRPFRLAAGLPAPGDDLGGWYSSRIGESIFGPFTFGQWLSGLSRYYAITGDEATRAKVSRLISGFAATVDERGSMFTITRDRFQCYPYDKLVVGLTDAQHYCADQNAHVVLENVTRAAAPYLPGRAIDEFAPEKGAFESYTIPENQFIVWERGGSRSYRETGEAYLHEEFFQALAEGRNVLPRRHPYSHVNALCSAAKAYLVLGEERYLQAAINGFRFMEAQSYATGAWGARENFLLTPEQAEEARNSGAAPSRFESIGAAILNLSEHFETPCGCYAHFKLTRYLLRITKDTRYGDSMERLLYNAALGVLPLNKYGQAFYQSNYHRYARKAYFDGYGHVMEDEWPCCSGTLLQLAADYHVSAYFRDDAGPYVNLYIPSTLRWTQSGADVTLTQTGSYPLSDRIAFRLRLTRRTEFAIRFRIPAWADGATLRVNEEAVSAVGAGRFAEVRRVWRSGDRVELHLPMAADIKPADEQHPDLVALTHGPMVLFAIGYDLPKLDRASLLAARQIAPEAGEWRSGNVRFLPWWGIRDEVYTTYHDVS